MSAWQDEAIRYDRPCQVVLVRHGESMHNMALAGNPYFPNEQSVKPVKGIPDHKIELSPRGKEQAIKTGIGLKYNYCNFDVVYHSNYVRTMQTVDYILQAWDPIELKDLKIRGDDRLRERAAGYIFHMTKPEIDHHFPYFAEERARNGYFYTPTPGGESPAQVCDRTFLFNGQMFQHRAGKRVLVVAHAGSIRAIRKNLEKWSAEEFERSTRERPGHNCGVWHYNFNEHSHRLELVSEDKIYY